MRHNSYKNDFDLHENETACRTHFHVKGFTFKTPFETEARELRNSLLWQRKAACKPSGP